jgi:hypothetical protein
MFYAESLTREKYEADADEAFDRAKVSPNPDYPD